MKTHLIAPVLAILVVTGTAPLAAHHAFSAEFDNDRPLDMRGIFVRMDWVNPHSWVHVEVTLPDGTKQVWQAETPPPNQLIRQGWRRTDLKVGDEIVVRGFAAKDGSTRMWAQTVRIVAQNGQALDEPRTVLSMFAPNPDGIPDGLLPGQ
jgi:hypothetical protein